MLFAEERWSDALRILEESISLGEYLEDIVATPKGRLAEIAALPDVYERLAFCLAKLGRYSDAFQALEAGKTRVLRKLVPVRESGVPDGRYEALAVAPLWRITRDNARRRHDFEPVSDPTEAS